MFKPSPRLSLYIIFFLSMDGGGRQFLFFLSKKKKGIHTHTQKNESDVIEQWPLDARDGLFFILFYFGGLEKVGYWKKLHS